jgi:hypothetical protein
MLVDVRHEEPPRPDRWPISENLRKDHRFVWTAFWIAFAISLIAAAIFAVLMWARA